MFRSNTAIGTEFITSTGYPQSIFVSGEFQPLRLFNEFSSNTLTGTQSFNGGTQTLLLTTLGGGFTPDLQNIIYVRGSGSLAGFFQVVSVEVTGLVIDTPFTVNQTGTLYWYGKFQFTTNISENMEVSVRGISSNELPNGLYPGPTAFTSIFDNGGPDNNGLVNTGGDTSNIVSIGRIVQIYSTFNQVYEGFLRVLGTPTANQFVIDHQYVGSDAGLWQSAVIAPVVKYTGTDTIKAVVEIQITADDTCTFAVFLKTGSRFALVPDSISNDLSSPGQGQRLTFTISELPMNAEIAIAYRPVQFSTQVNVSDIRLGVYGVTASAGAISGVPLYQNTLVNGGNPLIPGGTNFDGGNVVYPNMADPVVALDGANMRWVEGLVPTNPNVIFVKSEDDFGSVANIRGNPYHIVSQSTVFVLSEPIDLTTGGIGINASGISCTIVGMGKNASTINQLNLNTASDQPIFAITDMQDAQLVLQNLSITRDSGRIADLFDIETVNNLNIFNDIYLSNCRFNSIQNGGTINYNGASGRIMIESCFFDEPSTGIIFTEVGNLIVSNNTLFNIVGGNLDFFNFTNNLQSRMVASNNRLVSFNVGTYLANINNVASSASFYTFSNNDIRVAQYFNPAGLNETSPQVKLYGNTYIDASTAVTTSKSSKYFEQVLYTFSTATTIPGASFTPVTVPLGSDQGSSSTPVQLASNVITFNESGFYFLIARFTFGRTGSSGVETCALQLFLGGFPVQNQMFPADLSNADGHKSTQLQFSSYFLAGTTLTLEIANITVTTPQLDIGLIPVITNSIAGWIPPAQTDAVSPSFELIISKAV